MLSHGLPQKRITLFRPVAFEGFAASHIVNGVMHRLGDGRRQRLRYVADPQTNDLCVGIGL